VSLSSEASGHDEADQPSPQVASPIDIEVLQTASSLEILLLGLYRKVLSAPYVQNGVPLFGTFAAQTLAQHDAHRQAVQALCASLGGRVQIAPDPKYKDAVDQAKLTDSKGIIGLLSMFEGVIASTYQADLSLVSDPRARSLVASIMGVESQHLAVLQMLQVLVGQGSGRLFEDPLAADLGKFPPEAVRAALAQTFPVPTNASPPPEGASK
jgi:hypothetical protein